MNVKQIPKATIASGGIFIIYIVGVIGFSIPRFQPLFISLTPLNLLGGFSLLMLFHKSFDPKFIILGSCITLLGFLIEMIGVNTGVIFGEYAYGKTLGIGLMETPFLIGLNWFLLVYMTWDITGRISDNNVLKIVLSALLMLIYDWVMEPVAIATDMWQWAETEIPMQNYIAWYIIAATMFTMLAISKIKIRNSLSITLFLTQLAFFGCLNIVLSN